MSSVTSPRIISFGNERVNQGQASVFNCTVAAFPTPRDDEIRLLAPIGKHVTLIQSLVLGGFLYTRSSLFQVSFYIMFMCYECTTYLECILVFSV